MKKNLLILPLVAFALVACGGGNNPTSGGLSRPSEVSTPSSAPAEGGDGLTAATALTASQAVAMMEAAGSGNIVGTDVQYYVKGTFDAGTTVNATYHQWYGTDGQFKVSGATNDSGVTIEEADGNLDGKQFIVKGFMELYNGEYKIGYLPASASPTKSKFVPSLVSIDGSDPVEPSSSAPASSSSVAPSSSSSSYSAKEEVTISNAGNVTISSDAYVGYNFTSLEKKSGSGDNGRLSAAELTESVENSANVKGITTVTGTNAYQGYLPSSGDTSVYRSGVDGCIRLGGSKKTGELVITVSEAVSSIKLSISGWLDTDKVSVNSQSDVTLAAHSYEDVTFNFTAATTVTITTTNRAFIQAIQLFK